MGRYATPVLGLALSVESTAAVWKDKPGSSPTDPLLPGGNFDVDRDAKGVARPDAWSGAIVFHQAARNATTHPLARAFRAILSSLAWRPSKAAKRPDRADGRVAASLARG